ncbi:LysE/ArgO family amino acid transporter [Microbacterium terricola]|uniref:Amino acid transporter n=1 Tax=Microbacterium terricola TaxID=344163 RepID=A0ABM8E0P4_9MICO|nr:LysE/ArgO family amino acid transporter [Microbacterium terricola]UYK40755.1 LysE/ArgO family amino acid transporter [Microbacterium terricola]BDV31507.1 amino acid transporter [Microbacterium terricola]
MLSPVLAGLGLGFSLIVAIGAQNLFVLRQGIRREHAVLVAALCAASDAVLIVLGVSGIGVILQTAPWLVVVVRWLGAAFLIGYGLLAARRVWRPSGTGLALPDQPAETGTAAAQPATSAATLTRTRVAPVVLTCLALTWLNPHVYLDTLFLLGSIANTHGEGRWAFALGAATASVVWFFSLAIGARYLGRWLATPRAWRILDAVIAVVMIVLGLSLVLAG